jgi:serine/threonine protein kinase/Tfp pilus assembly protein PilF
MWTTFNMNPRDAQPTVAPAKAPAIADYELLRHIASGAYGEVWLARNVVGTLRAVKIVRRDQHASAESFEREFKGLQKFEPVSRAHEGLVDILTLGLLPDGEGFYYVMELADDANVGQASSLSVSEGKGMSEQTGRMPVLRYAPRTLRADLKSRGALPADEVIGLGLKLTAALAHLHAQGLVHRDVKPSNILFIGGEPKLADAGLVAAVDDARSLVGTAGYIAPEGPGTPQADLYALGKVLYEAAFGKDRQDFPQLPADVASRPDHRGLLELNAVLLKACATNPRERYQSADEIYADLERLRGGKSVRRAHLADHLGGLARRGVGWMAMAAVVLSLVLLASRVRPPRVSQAIEKRSTNEVANRFYDLGRHFFEKNTAKDLEAAATNFDQAIEADPRFAQAYAARALAYTWTWDGWEQLPQAKREALKALELDDSLGDPHIVLGWYAVMREWNWTVAEQEFKHAIQLNPSGAIGHHFYAEFLRMKGRTNESVNVMARALQLEPLSVPINRRFTGHLIAARRFDEAIKQADQAIAMEPNTPTPQHGFRIRALCALGRYDEAIETEQKERLLKGESTEQVDTKIGALKEALATEGAKGYWRRQLEEAKQAGVSPFWQARAYAQMGEDEPAIQCLRDAVKARDVWLTFHVMTDWTLDPVRSDPRFHDILKEMGLQ